MTRRGSIALGLLLALGTGPALAQDAGFCLYTAERVLNGEQVADEEKREAREACLQARAATGSIVQKYQLREADFAIMGTGPKPESGR
jgi:hypothetical protein